MLLIHSLLHIYFLFFCSVFLLVNGVWLVVVTMNVDVWKYEGMVNFINNIVSFFIIVMMSQMLTIPVGWLDDTGQTR